MSYKETTYIAKSVDQQGHVTYTDEENGILQELLTRQLPIIQGRACNEFIKGIELLQLSNNRIPQCHEISARLKEITVWGLEPVAALVPFDRFFYLLAKRKFPAATFIRTRNALNYLQEPDIFHEIFGHCP